MINVIPSHARHRVDLGWLDARWHFSFGEYYDPNNVSFGPLRVFNDDVARPGGGFDMHPHRDMEIITYVTRGALRHRDHLGNDGLLRPGEVQVMSAGKGIVHAEHNASDTDDAALNQIWITPRTKGGQPRWAQRPFTAEQRHNRLLPVVSADGAVPGTLPINQDATLYVSNLDAGATVRHDVAPGRRAYLFVNSGAVTVNGQAVNQGDQARIEQEPAIDIAATAESELVLIDLP